MMLLLLLLAVAGAAALLVAWARGRRDFFAQRGVACARGLPPLGSTWQGAFGLRPFAHVLLRLHREGRGRRVLGFFQFAQPIFLVRDPSLLKQVMVKQFDHFVNRIPMVTDEGDPLFNRTLFNLRDQRWKAMRTTLSPAFTTSKIKTMFLIILECTLQTAHHLREEHDALIKNGQKQPLEVDMKNLFTRMANDVIATVAFGVTCDSLKDANNEFYLTGKEMTTFSFWRSLPFILYLVCPKLAQMLRLRVFALRGSNYFDSLVHDTIRERQQKGIFRPDMLQLLMQAREGKLKADAGEEHETDKFDAKQQLSDTDVTAQSVGFFFAGFETVSTALCFTAYALGRHPDAQATLQQEVDDMMRATGGKPTYEAVQGMKYLDAVISESLRLFPPVQVLNRVCSADAVCEGEGEDEGDLLFRKGDIFWLPVFALHTDPNYWEDPDKFDPERFSDENKHKIKPFTYMPFGIGPRFCIAQRLAILEMKMAVVNLLAVFDIRPSPKTAEPFEFEKGFTNAIRGGFWNLIVPRRVSSEGFCEKSNP